MIFPELYRATLAFKQAKIDTLAAFKQFKHNYENGPPAHIREQYDNIMHTLITKQQEIYAAHEEVDAEIQEFEECHMILEEMYKVSEDIKLIVNRGQVGTLEGMSRQTITESGIVPDNFLQAAVLDQPYNENRRGGRSGRRGVSTTKRKNRANKKTNKKTNKKKKQICSKKR